MSHPYVYIGCFVPKEELFEKVSKLRSRSLHTVVAHPHVTFEYAPESVDETLFGEEIEINIVGYANDGQNEGVKVGISSQNTKIQEMASRIRVPHITLSVSEDGEAVNTAWLRFRPVEPVAVKGRFGGRTESGEIII